MQPLRVEASLLEAAAPCAHLLARAHGKRLNRTTSSDFERGEGYVHETGYFKRINSYKWQLLALTQFDVVLFADADLEVMPIAEQPAAAAGRAWARTINALLRAPTVTIVANPDGHAPLNTGFMLLKPSRALFDEGVRVMRGCRFSYDFGWDHVGRPRTLGVSPALLDDRLRDGGGRSAGGVSRWRSTRAFKRNNWFFPSSECDQGFFFYMLYVRNATGAYGVEPDAAAGKRCPVGRHWWATFKPWRSWPLADRLVEDGAMAVAGYAKEILQYDPMRLAKMYDYVVHEDAPVEPRTRTPAGASRCATGQRRLRRAIEAHAHFDEVFALWQDHQWTGNGYPDWPVLPCSLDAGSYLLLPGGGGGASSLL